MSAAELAARLHGRQYRNEITKDEERLAKDAGLVVLFGASDDLAEFRGAIHDEAGCYDGGDLVLVDGKPYEFGVCDCRHADAADKAAKARGALIRAHWCLNEWSWSYETTIQHATFDIFEDDEPYCRGIVFDVAALEPKP